MIIVEKIITLIFNIIRMDVVEFHDFGAPTGIVFKAACTNAFNSLEE